MASLVDDPGGRRRVLFYNARHERKVLRLGRVDRHWAETARGHIEKLADAAIVNSSPPPETSVWVAALPDVLRRRFAAVGLVAATAEEAALTLGAFVDSYLASRTDLKPGTLIVLGQAARSLLGFCGRDKPLRAVTEGDAGELREHLLKTGLATTTTGRRVLICKQFFAHALRKKLIDANPFVDMRGGCAVNTTRQRYIDRATAQRVLDACPPDSEVRLLFGLARYGGLRCPSEVLGLRWGDIDWGGSRMTVDSPKTARHAGHERRTVPLFPEVRALLQAAFDAAPAGSEFVIRNCRGLSSATLTARLWNVLRRAGVAAWPKPWVNLRASCATDLAKDFAPYLAARWLGHSIDVANTHYWTVRDADFDRAAAWTPAAGCGKEAQKAAQTPTATACPALTEEGQIVGGPSNDSDRQGVSVVGSDISRAVVVAA